MDKVINLKGGDLKLKLTPNTSIVEYEFYRKGHLVTSLQGNTPDKLSTNSNISKEIKDFIDPNGELNRKVIKQRFMETKEAMYLLYKNMLHKHEKEVQQKLQQEQDELYQKLDEAKLKLQEVKQPLIYIGSLVDWLTAGERNNILYCFCAFSSQILLDTPISIIGLGESASGKSHVMEVALSLIPEKYIVNEKKITQSALFNRSKEDPYFYQRKICFYGDMGGTNDQADAEEVKALMKELQTEGHLVKPISMLDETGNWVTENLELWGNPCLAYTTVPNYEFDSQELSRSIVYTPRTDNNAMYYRRKKSLEVSFGKSCREYMHYKKEAELIPYMVEHLRGVVEGYEIINPYISIINSLLEESKYYKRDFDKYNSLLKVITALNFYNNVTYEFSDVSKVLFTSKNDVQLFISLITPYIDSIAINVTPMEAEILRVLQENMDNWKTNSDEFIEGITTNDYIELVNPAIGKRSVQRYFSNLNSAGLLKIVGKSNKFNIYDLSKVDSSISLEKLQTSDDEVYDYVADELGHQVADELAKEEMTPHLSINSSSLKVNKPPW